MLNKIFIDIQKNKKEWLKSKKGSDFEDRIEASLKRYGFNRIDKDDKNIKSILNSIKNSILDKKSNDIIDNIYCERDKSLGNCFICQPYGSQDFPDFLIFTNKKIISIEVKYSGSKSSKPMWNSNLPKANAIYIFGSYGREDVTFFLGSDVLPMPEREELINFFDEIKKLENNFRKNLKEKIKNDNAVFNRGFDVWIKRAYQQDKIINNNPEIDYFSHINRIDCENNVIRFCEILE